MCVCVFIYAYISIHVCGDKYACVCMCVGACVYVYMFINTIVSLPPVVCGQYLITTSSAVCGV